MGPWMCLALVVGNMIGSGIFLLPAALAPYGANVIFGWLLTISGALCLAYVIARLAQERPDAGGPHGFTLAAFGPLPAFLVMWSFWISIWVSNAALAIAAVSYLSRFFPAIAGGTPVPATLAVAFVWLLIAINSRGARAAGSLQIATSILKLLPLIAVVIIAAIVVGGTGGAAVPETMPVSGSSIAACATLTLWALLGFESAALSSEKVANAASVVPRATVAGTLIAGIVYLFACSAIIFLMPAEMVARSPAPFADFVETFWRPEPAALVALFACVSALGALNGWVLLSGEIPLTLARNGVFPAWFGDTDRRGTPIRAQLLGGLLTTLLVAANYSRGMTDLFAFMALLATAATLFLYLACALAALEFARRGYIRSAGLVIIAVMGLCYALWAFYGAGSEATGWGSVLLLSGVPVYLVMRRSSRAAADREAALPG